MQFTWDPIYATNLALCIIILVLGCWGYKKSKDRIPVYIGIAFGLFGISHLLTLFGFKGTWENDVLIVIRLLAYLIVAFALYLVAFKRAPK